MNRTGIDQWLGSREVLCVDPVSRTRDLRRELEASGWKVSLARNVEEVAEHLEAGDHGIGLLYLVENSRFAEEVLAVDQYMHWIAILSDDILMNEDTQRLLSRHFYDYHRTPVDIQRLTTTLGHASGIAQLRKLYNHGTGRITETQLIGDCPPMQAIRRNIARVARKDFSVLITGESGTGKELIARAIHDNSERSDGPFVAVNCGALSSSLIQSELFGHEKGAFTGADKRRVGRFEAASGGTLFLDEIGDLSMDVQVNLLRVLEQGVIERVGDNQPVPVDTRIVAATNIDLNEAVEENRFREDLYYRINVFQIYVPPLCERGDDLLKLAEAYLSRLNNEDQPKTFSKTAIAAMHAYTWPGNVRELINRIQRAHVSCDSRLILPKHLGLESIEDSHLNVGPTLEEARNETEKKILSNALWRNTNNLSRVARELAVSRVTLYRLIKKHSLEAADRR